MAAMKITDGVYRLEHGGFSRLYYLYRKILFTGDLFRERNGVIEEISSAMAHDALQAKQAIPLTERIDFEIACPGHGDPVIKAQLLSFIRELSECPDSSA